MKISVRKLLSFGTGVITAAVFIVLAISIKQNRKVRDIAAYVKKTTETLTVLQNIIIYILDNEASARGYLVAGEKQFLKPMYEAERNVNIELALLEKMIPDDSSNQYLKDSVRTYCGKRITFSNLMVSKRVALDKTVDSTFILTGEGEFYTNQIRRFCIEIIQRLRNSLDKKALAYEQSIVLLNRSLYGILISGLILGLIVIRKIRLDTSELARNEQRFISLLNAAPDATVIVNASGIITMVNRQMNLLFGYHPDEIIGKPIEQLIPEELGTAHKAYRDNYLKAAHVRPMGAALELQGVKKDGSRFPAEISLSPISLHEGKFVSAAIRDITGRKKSELKFRALLDSAPDAMVILDDIGIIQLINFRTEKLFGFTQHELVGQHIHFLIPQTGGHSDLMLEEVKSHGIVANFESEAVKKGGTAFPAEISLSLVDTGDTNLISVAIRNITRQRKAREQLELLSYQIEETHDAIYTVDGQRQIITWNKGAEKLYGYSRQEAIGTDSVELLKTIIPGENIQSVQKYISETDYWSGELLCKTKNGNEIRVQSSSTTILSGVSHIRSYVNVGFDITEHATLRERVAYLASLVDQASDAIISTDLDGKLISWNRGAEKMLGYSAEEAIGKTHGDLGFITLSQEEIKIIERELLLTGTWKAEKKYYTKNGNLIHGKVTGNVVTNDNNEPRGIIFIIVDISQRKELEEQLKKYAEELEEKVKARTADVYRNEKKFRALLENNYDMITLLDRNFRIVYRSPSASRITGWPDEEMIWKDGKTNVHPDDMEYAGFVIKELMATPGKPIPCRFRNMQRNGQYLWLEGVVVNMLHDEFIDAIVFNFRDVTLRAEAEEKLKISEERFRRSLDNMMEGVQIIGFDWKFSYVNEAVAKHARYPRHEMLGKTIMELFPGIEQSPVFKIYQKCFNEREPIRVTTEFEYPDKSKSWFELSFQPIPEGIFVLSIDISERKKAEAEQLLLTSIINHSDDAIISEDMDGNITSWNKGAEVMFGYSAAEAVNRYASFIIPDHLAEEKARLTDEVHQGRSVHHHETSRIRKDNKNIYVSLTISPIRNINLDIIGASTISRDITARKEAESQMLQSQENLRAIFENSSEGFILLDSNGIVKTFNHKARESALFTPGNNLEAGKNVYDYLDEERIAFFKSVFDRAMKGEIIFYDRPYKNVRNEITWINFSFNPVKKKNVISGVCITGRDITERKNAEENYRLSNERYEAVSKATSDAIWDYSFISGKTYIVGDGYSTLFGYPCVNGYAEHQYWRKHLHPEEKHRVIRDIRNTLSDPRIEQASAEYRFRREDGSYAFINDRFFIFREKGLPVRMLGAKQDITARVKAENQLRENLVERLASAEKLATILNTLPANIAILTNAGVVDDVNYAWREFADSNGYTGSNYGIGDNYISISANADGEEQKEGMEVAVGIREVLDHHLNKFVCEYPCHSQTEQRWFRMIVTPLAIGAYTGAVVMHVDITEHKLMDIERLEMKNQEQIKITRAMLQGQEKERHAIGLELHDNVNQILVGTKLMLSFAKNYPDKSAEMIAASMDNLKIAIDENRKIAHVFVSPDINSVSLVEQLRKLLDSMLVSVSINVIVDDAAFNEISLDDDRKINIYRIAQEQCTNIVNYAHASEVKFEIRTVGKEFYMCLQDNGRGMDADNKSTGIGLRNINSRLAIFNGRSTITTAPGEGFKFEIFIPLD